MNAPAKSPSVRLTPGGRLVVSTLGLVTLVGVGSQLFGGSGPVAGPAPTGATQSTVAASTPRTTPSASPRAAAASGQASARPTARRTMVHSGLSGNGQWRTAKLHIPPASKTPRVLRYAVRVESNVPVREDEAARQVASILNDKRGWTGFQGLSFELVADPGKAERIVLIASPTTTDRLCLPLRTGGTWNCQQGRNVVLNSDRWLYMAPTYSDLTAYRAYQVNHEMGHAIGQGHRTCPGKGRPAPVMLQQSMSLQGCAPNPWRRLEKG